MTEKESGEIRTIRLRRLAEERGRKGGGVPLTAMSEDALALIHDLQVHQIQLEMQNEELREAQEQLGVSLARYSDLYDFAPVGYVSSDSGGIILEANLTFAGQLGIERGRLIETPLWLYAIAKDRDKFRSHLDRLFATRERLNCELRLERANGGECYMQLDSIWMLNADGTGQCRTSFTDITVRREAEEALSKIHEEMEQRVGERTAELSEKERKYRRLSHEFHTLLSTIGDSLLLVSADMKVLWTNHGDAIDLDAAASGAVAQYCYRLLHDRSVASEDNPISRCFATGEKEIAVLTQNGSVLDIRAFPINEAGKVGSVLLLVGDITEKMARQAEAMHAAHLASLGELAAGVAHEINNPITGIINYGQILINECSTGAMEKDIGERIVKEGERVSRIVKTLLSYAREGVEEKKHARVPDIMEESLILARAQIRKDGIHLKINLPDDLPEVDANSQQIQQCFLNIINNARYALNERYPARHEDKYLEITGETVIIGDRPFTRINFYDHGVGIADHELLVLTKPFFSTKPFGKGTGVGLSITQKIITDHGGRLSFESTKGEFTRVIVDLPANQSNERVGNGS